MAELLDLPMAAYVCKATCRERSLRVERTLDGVRERLLLPLPALITVAGRCGPKGLWPSARWKRPLGDRSSNAGEGKTSRWTRAGSAGRALPP